MRYIIVSMFYSNRFFAGKILINQWKYKKAQKEYDTLQKQYKQKNLSIGRNLKE